MRYYQLTTRSIPCHIDPSLVHLKLNSYKRCHTNFSADTKKAKQRITLYIFSATVSLHILIYSKCWRTKPWTPHVNGQWTFYKIYYWTSFWVLHCHMCQCWTRGNSTYVMYNDIYLTREVVHAEGRPVLYLLSMFFEPVFKLQNKINL